MTAAPLPPIAHLITTPDELSFVAELAVASDLIGDVADQSASSPTILGALLTGQPSLPVVNVLLVLARELTRQASRTLANASPARTVESLVESTRARRIFPDSHLDEVRLVALTVVDAAIEEEARRSYVRTSSPTRMLVRLAEYVLSSTVIIADLADLPRSGDLLRVLLELPAIVPPPLEDE